MLASFPHQKKLNHIGAITQANQGPHVHSNMAETIHVELTGHASSQDVKLTSHPAWAGTSLSNAASDVFDLFIPELQQRFGDDVIAVGDQKLSCSAIRRSTGMATADSGMPAVESREVAAYIHLCSHLLNLLQNIAAVENLPQLSETLKGVGKAGEGSPHVSTVITAHPTRLSHPDFATQKTIILNMVSKLSELNPGNNNPGESKYDELSANLARAIKIFCNTPALRSEKPSVEEEHDELLVDPFPTLQNAVKHVGRATENGIGHVRVRTWAAGDHDGHPGVTHDILETAAVKRSVLVLNDYKKRLDKLETKILDRGPPNDQTWEAIKLIRTAKQRAEATIEAVNNPSGHQPGDFARYDNSPQLLNELDAIGHAMQKDYKLQVLIDKTLNDLKTRVGAFGLHYASVDLRQNSAVFEQIILHLTDEGAKPYNELSESERVDVLSALIRDPVRLAQLCEKSVSSCETTQRELALVGSALRLQKTISPEAIGYQIIANTEQQSDILEAIVTVIAAGGFDPETKELAIPVVPLFETLEDLRRCDQIMAATLATYQELGISLPNDIQPVMVGYSDSNKDGGIFAARVAVFDAVTRLNIATAPYGQKLEIFHGCGGSEARGGGDVVQTIKARSTVGDTTDMTVQGEAANHLLASRKLGAANLAGLIAANDTRLKGRLNGTLTPDEDVATHMTILSELANISETHYREFHDSEIFNNVFFALNKMLSSSPTNPGSRPASRTAGSNDLASVRAITHNTPTTAARMMFQAFFGVGTALEKYCASGDNALTELQQLYDASPQFKSIIDDIETALAKANPDIAHAVFSLLPAEQRNDAEKFLTAWKSEFDLTKKHLFAITRQNELMENKPEQKAMLEERLIIADAACEHMLEQIAAKTPAAEVAVTLSTVINMMGAV